jgi:hypothetical protein
MIVTDKNKRSPWILLAWPGSLLVILAVIWISGYVYWQIRISRAIAELKKGPAKYTDQLFYADPDLLEIGSRGIPRVLREWEQALDRGDEDQAFALACGLSDLQHGASEVSTEAAKASSSYTRSRERPSMKEMRENCRDYLEDWREYESWYAPWWKWWQGHRGRY